MDAQIALRAQLNESLAELRQRNPSYSLRAFARKLALNPGALSGILNGKRLVSRTLAERILERLHLAPAAHEQLLQAFSPLRQAPAREQLRYTQLSADQYHVMADWPHFAVLSLVKTAGYRHEPAWVARRLGLRPTEARGVLERLERLGLLKVNARGQARRTRVRLQTSDNVANASLRQAQARNLELARESLERDGVHQRDFTALTLAFAPAKLPEAKRRIRAFQDELAEFLEAGPSTEVYKICMQVFPLTRMEQES